MDGAIRSPWWCLAISDPGGPDPWDPPNSICLLTDPTYAGIDERFLLMSAMVVGLRHLPDIGQPLSWRPPHYQDVHQPGDVIGQQRQFIASMVTRNVRINH
jgi:hypothetical protein